MTRSSTFSRPTEKIEILYILYLTLAFVRERNVASNVAFSAGILILLIQKPSKFQLSSLNVQPYLSNKYGLGIEKIWDKFHYAETVTVQVKLIKCDCQEFIRVNTVLYRLQCLADF